MRPGKTTKRQKHARETARLAALARKGQVTLAKRPSPPLPPRRGVAPLRKILEELTEDREGR
ncbi:MAG: hypothetical protein AB1405_05195 [Bdellovibrionota bacterium]